MTLGVRFLKLALKHCRDKTFSWFLGTSGAQLVKYEKSTVDFSLKIPNRICRTTDYAKAPVLSIGPLVAIFDEMSSYAVMVLDRNRRGGVSVYLRGQMLSSLDHMKNHRPLTAGDNIIVSTTCNKIGKALAFCDITMNRVEEDGRHVTVATGYQVKYLPMGLTWDIISHPRILVHLLPILEKISTYNHNSTVSQLIKKAIGGADGVEMFHVANAAAYEDTPGKLYELLDVKQCPPDKKAHGYEKSYNFTTIPLFQNALGILHGGVVACTSEHISLLNRVGTAGNEVGASKKSASKEEASCLEYWPQNGFVDRLSVSYLSPMTGKLQFVLENSTEHSNLNNSVQAGDITRGKVLRSGGKKKGGDSHTACAEFECHWQSINSKKISND